MIPIGRSGYYPETRYLIRAQKKKKRLRRTLHVLFMLFIERPGELISEQVLLDTISGNKNCLHTYVSQLNKVLRNVDGTLIVENKYGVGYTLKIREERSFSFK